MTPKPSPPPFYPNAALYTVQVPSGCSLCPLLAPLHCAGVADGDGPGRQVPGRPQQQHQLPGLLPGWQPVQICPPVNIHLGVLHPTGTGADHDQITKMIVRH